MILPVMDSWSEMASYLISPHASGTVGRRHEDHRRSSEGERSEKKNRGKDNLFILLNLASAHPERSRSLSNSQENERT